MQLIGEHRLRAISAMAGPKQSNNSRRYKMTFCFTLVPEIPRLAWLLRLEMGVGVAQVFHGKWVETRTDGFVEGCWAGTFDQMGFDTEFMTGTGARLRNGSLLLVTPNHWLDRICSLKKGNVTYFSNSLPFILAYSQEQLDDEFLFYDSYIASIRQGLSRYEREIPTRSGNKVHLHYCTNIVVNENNECREEPKRPSPSFADYQTYRAYLDTTIRGIAANATDKNRKVVYSLLTTVSRGYDSPAAAVLARAVGCDRAVTLRESRRSGKGEDCGTEIAGLLGIAVQEFGRLDYRDKNDFSEIRTSGGPSEFLSFGPYLRGTLLFTGYHGSIWNRHADPVSRDLVCADAGGTSLTEFRIEIGFTHLPVPFIGADSHPSIDTISNSDEMSNWTVGGTYDRPIPRRIVEEAGIPRHMFGQKKRAAGVYVTAEGMERTMSDASLRDFNRFVHERWGIGSSLKMGWYRGIRKVISYNELLKRIGARALRMIGIRGSGVPMLISARLRMLAFGYLGKESMLFHWGVHKLVQQYRAALSARS